MNATYTVLDTNVDIQRALKQIPFGEEDRIVLFAPMWRKSLEQYLQCLLKPPLFSASAREHYAKSLCYLTLLYAQGKVLIVEDKVAQVKSNYEDYQLVYFCEEEQKRQRHYATVQLFTRDSLVYALAGSLDVECTYDG